MKIVSIGEILFDCFQNKKVLGGAPFNFFYHTYKLTNNAQFVSRIGSDADGKTITNFFNNNNISTDFLQVDDKHPTGLVKVILNSAGIPVFDIEINCAYDFIELNYDLKELLTSNTQLLYFGTLAQRNSVSRNTIQSALGKNIKYFCDVNLRSNFYSREILHNSLMSANVLKLNIDELKTISELFLNNSDDLETSAKNLMHKYNLEMLSITLGEEGALLIDKKTINKNKYPVSKMADTVGAGDAYSAILCIGYLNKMPVDQINFLATKFASVICSINGAIPDNDDIYDQFKEDLKLT